MALEATFTEHNRPEVDWANLVTPEERQVLNSVLVKLAHAAHEQERGSEWF